MPEHARPARDGESLGHPSSRADRGPARRSVLLGPLWAVPAIALMTTTPVFAASGTALSFSGGPFEAPRCGTLDAVVVRAHRGGAGVAGLGVVLELAGGFTFDGATTTSTVVTGPDGSVSCGSVRVPAEGGTGTITATAAGAASSTASLNAAADGRLLSLPHGTVRTASAPAGATPVAGDLFLASGVLHRDGVGAVQHDVVAFGQLAGAPGASTAALLPLRTTDGIARVFDTATNTCSAAAGVPAGAVPVAADVFLAGTSLVRGGAVVATDVAAVGQMIERERSGPAAGRAYDLPFRRTDGAPRVLRSPENEVVVPAEYGAPGGPPAGAVPVAGDLFWADGRLYRVSRDGTHPFGTGVVATGIAAWGALTPHPYFAREQLLPVRQDTGAAAVFMVSGNALRAATAVPTGATPVAADLFLAGGVVYQDAVGAVARQVAAAGHPFAVAAAGSSLIVPLSTAVAC